MDEIVVDPGSSAAQFSIMQSQQPPQHGPEVRLTAAGVPRKKPGRKPKPKEPADENSTATEQQPKQRRPRKPRDPNAPPIQRKRKAAATDAPDAADTPDHDTSMEIDTSLASANRYSLGGPSRLEAPIIALDQRAPKIPKRETHPVSMSHLLNEEAPPSKPPPAATRQVFDPIRGSYDPVRETMVSRDVFGTGSIMGSPRAPTSQPVNRASASPSIASLVDPPAPPNIISPVPSHQTPYNTTTTKSRLQESTSASPAPPNPVRSTPQQITKPTIIEVRRAPPPPSAPAASQRKPSPPKNSFTSMATVPPTSSAAAATKAATEASSTIPPPTNNKKLTALVQQEHESTNSRGNKTGSNHSSEAVNKRDGGSNSLKDALLPPLPSVGGGGAERSILDFGKVNPGQEIEAPSIKIHIPLNGETNKYVNFMRMAEEQYGWDALHPRQAANRERKARIAAATAALEKSVGASGRESGEEMDEDIQSDAENSNVEMGGMGGGAGPLTNGAAASGPEAPAKPARKKRNFKEDEYDIDDDFVDDSEMLWEAQAAASRDGFFVYSGPLIPEVPKPEVAPPARRGRGGGRGSRGGRGGTARGGGANAGHGADGTATEKSSGRGRGGGPGSRGGRGGGDGTRKPRITKLEKEQREKERTERERLATITAMAKALPAGSAASAYMLGLSSPPAAAGGLPTAMMID